jgi:hypothetical protein
VEPSQHRQNHMATRWEGRAGSFDPPAATGPAPGRAVAPEGQPVASDGAAAEIAAAAVKVPSAG